MTRRGWKTAAEILTAVEADHGIHYNPDIMRQWRERSPQWPAGAGERLGPKRWIYNERMVLKFMADTGRLERKRKARLTE